MAFTYDLSTAIGQVRFLIPDTVEASAVFTDAEITYVLTLATDADPRLAAALALETIARSTSRLAKVIESRSYKSERFAIKDMLDAAQKLRNEVTGTLQTAELEHTGELLESYLPLWVDETYYGGIG